ncbi:MAG: hypothetical protein ACRD0J_13895, partial [Acidimicrobiales bacterium]
MTVAPTSTAMFARVLLSNLGTDQASIQHLEAELSTGRSLLAPSDNPSATVAVLGTQAAHARVQGYVASAKDGLSRLGLANQTMGSILAEVSQLQQAVESTSTASLSPVGMAALATRVQG